MERYTPAEARGEGKFEKSSPWKTARKWVEVAALSTLMTTVGAETLKAQAISKEAEPQDTRKKIEALQKDTADKEKEVLLEVAEKGRKGVANPGTAAEHVIRELKTPDNETVRVGYDKSDTKAQWLIKENGDASMRFYDAGADGTLDRIIINNDDKEKPAAKTQLNDFDTFGDIDALASEAKMLADMDPKQIKVYALSFENGEYVIRSVDKQTGEAGMLTGEGAEKMIEKVQGAFRNSLEQSQEKK